MGALTVYKAIRHKICGWPHSLGGGTVPARSLGWRYRWFQPASRRILLFVYLEGTWLNSTSPVAVIEHLISDSGLQFAADGIRFSQLLGM